MAYFGANFALTEVHEYLRDQKSEYWSKHTDISWCTYWAIFEEQVKYQLNIRTPWLWRWFSPPSRCMRMMGHHSSERGWTGVLYFSRNSLLCYSYAENLSQRFPWVMSGQSPHPTKGTPTYPLVGNPTTSPPTTKYSIEWPTKFDTQTDKYTHNQLYVNR